jgi:pepsin A
LTGDLYTDQVSLAGSTATQLIGSAKGPSLLPISGIVEFSSQKFNGFPNNSTSFFETLCTQGQVEECRFGLGLEDDESGSLVMDELATGLFDINLTVSPILAGWVVSETSQSMEQSWEEIKLWNWTVGRRPL